jgi:hypothetical protein
VGTIANPPLLVLPHPLECVLVLVIRHWVLRYIRDSFEKGR